MSSEAPDNDVVEIEVDTVRQMIAAGREIEDTALNAGDATVASREIAAVKPNVADVVISQDTTAERREVIDSLTNPFALHKKPTWILVSY